MSTKTRILLADDHPRCARVCGASLRASAVAEAADGKDAIDKASTQKTASLEGSQAGVVGTVKSLLTGLDGEEGPSEEWPINLPKFDWLHATLRPV